MTDAERQVAGKTYRYTERHHAAHLRGATRAFNKDGRCISAMTWAEAMLRLVAGGYAEEVAPEPEVKVGDQYEVAVAWPGGCPVGHRGVVRKVANGMVYMTCASGDHEPGAGVAAWSYWFRRLPPEPAKPLCECGEGRGGVLAVGEWPSCGCRGLSACGRGAEISFSCLREHREKCKRHRKPECACLKPSCLPCQAKLSDDALMFGRMKARDDEAAYQRVAAAAAASKSLPAPLQWSPAAMVGGMWAGMGRR